MPSENSRVFLPIAIPQISFLSYQLISDTGLEAEQVSSLQITSYCHFGPTYMMNSTESEKSFSGEST